MQMLLARPRQTASALVIQPEALDAASAVQFQRELSAMVARMHTGSAVAVVVDMRRIDTIDSAGIMALIAGFRLAKASNVQFSLCSVSNSTRMILELTRLDKVFEIVESSIAITPSLAHSYPSLAKTR